MSISEILIMSQQHIGLFEMHHGLKVVRASLLPVDVKAEVWDVETKQPAGKVATGETIKCVKLGDFLYVDDEIYEKMLKL